MRWNLTTAVGVFLLAVTMFPSAAQDAPERVVDPDAYAAFCAGIQTMESGDFTAAVRWFEKVLVLDPSSVDAHVRIGLICDERFHTPGKARKHFEEALRLAPDNFHARYGMGRQFLASGELDKAKEQMLLAVRSPAARENTDLAARAYMDLATAAESRGQRELALESYINAAAAASNPVYVLVRLGNLYRLMDQNAKAVEVFLRVKKLVPSYAQVYRDLAEAYEGNQNWREALVELETYMAHPDGPGEQDHLLRQAMNLAENAGLPDKARDFRQRLLRLLTVKLPVQDAPPDACERIADTLEELGELQQARPYLEKAATSATDETRQRLRAKLADLYGALGLSAEAIREYRAYIAAAADPESSIPFRIRLSELLDKTGKSADAESELKNILTIPGAEATGHAQLGVYYGRKGNTEEATKQLRKAIELSQPEEALQHRIQLGMTYADANRPAEAEQVLTEAQKLFPDDSEVNNALGWFYAERGIKLDTAKALIEAALKAQPDNPYYIDSLGWVYFKQGRKKEALEQLLRAAQLLRDGAISDHLGDVYLELGQPDKAGACWKDSLQLDPSIKGVRQKLEKLGQTP